MKTTAKLQKRYDQIKDGLEKEKAMLKEDIASNEKNIEEKTAALTECVQNGGASSDYVKLRRSIEDSEIAIEGDNARLQYLETADSIDDAELEKLSAELKKEAEELYQKNRTQIMKLYAEIKSIADSTYEEIGAGNSIMKKICFELHNDLRPQDSASRGSKRANDMDAFRGYLGNFPVRFEK